MLDNPGSYQTHNLLTSGELTVTGSEITLGKIRTSGFTAKELFNHLAEVEQKLQSVNYNIS